MLVSYLATTPASFVAFATTLMDWFRGQTIFRRRTDDGRGGGVTATSNQICVCSRSFTAVALLRRSRARRAGGAVHSWGAEAVADRSQNLWWEKQCKCPLSMRRVRSPANVLPLLTNDNEGRIGHSDRERSREGLPSFTETPR